MKNRIREVAFISKDLKLSYEALKDGKYEDKKLYKFIRRAIDDLKENLFLG